jgi:eukaryotic-like serine/threonine-protein kinase
MSSRNSAAAKLLAVPLENGWKVVAQINLSANQTGGNFSHGYKVENEGRTGFLKAFDFSSAFNTSDPDQILRNVQLFTSCFQHERDILYHCKTKRLSRVVVPIDQGSELKKKVKLGNVDSLGERMAVKMEGVSRRDA